MTVPTTDLENALFVKVRVVIDREVGEVPGSIAAVMSRIGGAKAVECDVDSETISYCAIVSVTDAPAIASLGELLADAKNIGTEKGMREIAVEIGRAADLPISQWPPAALPAEKNDT